MHRTLQLCLVLAIYSLASPAAHAQYPDKTITLVVPFPPGGVADTVARPLAEAMSRELKQPVVIDNKTGAGGAVGIGHAARASGDGYTLLLSLSSISILPEADKILERKPLFQLDQFKPIARITADPTVLVVRADSPWRTLEEFIADARRNPAAYNYGSSGNYGTMHVPMEMLKSAADFRMVHIPYAGAGPAVVALLGGHVDAISSGPASVVQHIRAGRLRALAHWGDAPLVTLPGVPSLKERGYNVQFAQWSALFAPASTPDAVVEKLRATMRKLMNDPSLQQTILTAGSPIEYLDAPQFATYWKTDAQRMTEAVKRIGKLE
ncbi:MAG: tripartite tricarboxylate transporter substrate binding protein [Burkholderiaceae bacterium]